MIIIMSGDSSVGIVTDCGLEDQAWVSGGIKNFSLLHKFVNASRFQLTSYPMGISGSSSKGKRVKLPLT
jgi:hypothetical protein